MNRFKLWSAVAAALIAALACGGGAWADAIADASMSADEIRSSFVESIGSGQPSFPYGLRKLGMEARADFVRAAGAVLIAYAKTADFRDRYAAWRQAHAPQLEELTADAMKESNDRAQAEYRKAQDEQNNAVAKFEAQRAEMKKAGLSDAQLDQFEAQMKQAVEQVKQMQANGTVPSGPQPMTEDQRLRENEARKTRYAADTSEFERAHPADPTDFIRARLRQFLDLSATVDFDAKVEGGRFADPSNEARPDDWKRCFRAGKPAVEAARAVAQEWLKGL